MLLPRCIPIHCPLRYMPPHEFHVTRAYSQKFRGAFQIEPATTKAKIDPGPPIPWHPQFKGNSQKSKKSRAGKKNEGKATGEGRPTQLSSVLQLHNRSGRHPRTVEGAKSIGSHTLPGRRNRVILDRKLPSLSASTKREAHVENAVQTVSNGDRGNVTRLPCSLEYLRRVDGVIPPRASGDPILEDVASPSPQSPIATLAHGLERALFNPGVQWLQDPRSQVYSFTTWLENIIPVKNFAFERLQPFVPSSRDQDLSAVAQREGRKYAGSTSSVSGLLSQLYYLLSGDKPINISNLSPSFIKQPRTFTPGQRGAASVILHYRDGVYLIDSATEAVPGLSRKNILTWMGTLLEKFLTHSPEEFLRLTRAVESPTAVATEPKREAYRYAKSDKFVLRSQLDCFDRRLPGTGVFDIKTRAVMTIRHDLLNFEENSGYQIRTLQGLAESFEKEYYDLIRSAFLKYSFQARIGNMDGVFVAYHNTKRIFGFQYIPLSEMDARLFGECAAGDAVFEKCLSLLEVLLEEATRELPRQSIRLTAEKREGEDSLKVFLEPADLNEELREPRPVIELDVSTKSYIGESAISGSSAIATSNFPWTVLWSVSKSALDPDIVRDRLAAAQKRAFHPFFLPTGVDIQEMEKVWHEMQFNPVAPVEVPFKPEFFRPPPRSVQVLRRLAQKGRNYLEHTIRKQEGKPRFVLGLPNDAQEVASLLALAHGPDSVQSVDRSHSIDADNTTTTDLSAESRDLEDVQGPVRSSDLGWTNVVSENRETAQKATAPLETELQTAWPFTADASEQPSRITAETPPTHSIPSPLALEISVSSDNDFIPESTLTHLEEMLSEDQRRIVGAHSSAGQTNRAHSMLSRPAAKSSKSRLMIKHLKDQLRVADMINGPGPVSPEEES